mmetsp:Transcript_28465/g.83206  ORF Transcript_28465/g.83206 Transcript_28465/m.83206 type:complete len:118 (+) Transcript_28465:269-622(+)
MDWRRCATVTEVRPSFTRRSASVIKISVSASTAEVTSSNRRMPGWRSRVRAMATRCRSPPESLAPLSPTRVSYPAGCRITASCTWAARAASITSFSDALGAPYRMLYATVLSKRSES